ncbi:nicotinamide-nucleotide amidase [Loktanella fryxellensis]|uniref:Nicotinamide-nucleotide amidase n=1 Tax=Loktanella fryxellensis TaxID=245187 RepID=A0A1H8I4R5_9RHOB|nr:CinA family protein [Loktanella fryxellensis]SEN62808.1 nicotinamide-nucleotide amidase [Loktanella fryxellensis]
MTAEALLDAASSRGIRIALAESCTGGLIAGAITAVAGSSAIFEAGFVTYSNAAKVRMIGVSQATLDAHGAVSEQVAAEMANGALARSGAQIALSVTGIAGPGGSEHKPEGRVCFGIATATDTHTETVDFGPLGRSAVRTATVDHALTLLMAAVTRQARAVP